MFTYDIRQDFREVEMYFFGLVPMEVAPPPLRLAGVDEDDAQFLEESAIVRGID